MSIARTVVMAIALVCPLAIGVTAARGEDAPVRDAKRAVFEIVVDHGAGSAFLVDDARRLAVTAAHVILGATSATARREGTTEHVTIEVVGVDEATDVAIVRIGDSSWSPGDAKPLAIAASSPATGDRVQALGFRFGEACNVYEGVVTAVMSPDDRARAYGVLSPGERATVIQTDCTLNQGLSGGPLIDGRGAVVGVNHALIDGGHLHNVFLAIDARHVRALLEIVDAEKTITWKEIARRGERARTGAPAAPRQPPPSPQAASGDVTRLLAALKSLDGGSVCRVCGGDGVKTHRVRDTSATPLFGRPAFREESAPCKSCDGSGYNNPKSMRKRLAAVTSALADVSDGDPRRGAAIDRCGEVLRASFGQHPKELEKILMASGATSLSRTTMEGQAIVLCGLLAERSWQNGREVIFVRLGGGDRSAATVAVLDPALADGKRGDLVLIGGRLSEWVTVKGVVGDVPGLSRGFVVTARRDSKERRPET